MARPIFTEFQPRFQQTSAPANEDADAYLERLVSEPCGTDGLTFSEKSGNSSAKSLAHAGKTIPASLAREVNARNKREAFAQLHPKEYDLLRFDNNDKVTQAFDAAAGTKYAEFKDFPRTNEEVEICNLLNSEREIPAEIRDKTAKHVAAIGGYSGLLIPSVAEKFATFAMNYWISKNPVLQARIELAIDGGK